LAGKISSLNEQGDTTNWKPLQTSQHMRSWHNSQINGKHKAPPRGGGGEQTANSLKTDCICTINRTVKSQMIFQLYHQ